ncbi:signal transduction histidine kinase [Parabacteroides sp. PFB2-12]|uniref:sensor histidine kinase n=1 Tax=unclassified Parabacteroides TaxID=2649774 RepID=UPI002474579C|nr:MULTISPECIES: ATP-binding protein [unclassified Parabacteroides]MDH6342894.1 signal transduction histidine kinase [Parabacteroides sp. PM6-13]MDH6390476.1 signal transduction histidine kinase [Parabacteroides sp. PFB2-12]
MKCNEEQKLLQTDAIKGANSNPNWLTILSGENEDPKETLKRLRLLSRIAFKANDIHASLLKINPHTKDYKDTEVTILYHWVEDAERPVLINWEHYISVFDEESCETFMANFLSVVKEGKQEVKFEAFVKFPEHARFVWREYIIYLYEKEEDGTTTVLVCSSDIDARKSQELTMEELVDRMEKADRMKSKYLADMSHEIRTPLNAITGFAEIMAFTDSAEERMAYYDVIKTNNQMLMQLINDILDLSKIEADVVKISYENIDVNDLVDSAYASTRLRMPGGVELILEKEQKECLFGTDPVRLLQLITNLANNAIKHTRKGSITIGYKSLPDGQLCFYVKDTGLGIPEEKQKQLFGRFAKVNDYAEGIGLGLAICQGLVTKMGGKLEVDSTEGVGSTFSFTLPSHDPSSEE